MTMAADPPTTISGGVGEPLPHESAHLHVSGSAAYTDDIAEPRNLVHAALGLSEHAHARLEHIDLTEVAAHPGVIAVITAADIAGDNNYGAVVADDPILAQNEVQYVGQPIFAVAASSVEAARKAATLANVTYTPLEHVLQADAAVAQGSFVLPSKTMRAGDSAAALAQASHRLQARLDLGGQDQFYLEGQIAMALPREDGDMLIYASTQHPSEVQHTVAKALNKASNQIMVECRRMGGAFGGKESQPALIACVCALLAEASGAPVKLRLDRDVDMIVTGKRHDFAIDFDAGFDHNGVINGLELTFSARCGMSADLSGAINDRTLFHCDNAYFIGDITATSHRAKTHTVSNTAFRGFGGPQGMFAIEYVIDNIARELQLDPLDVRRRNFYGIQERNTTPYGQRIEDNLIHRITDELEVSSDYRQRRTEIRAWNADSAILKRGIALTPVKFGISFTTTHLNQAGALLHIYTDGSVYLNHGGTEMGQGLFTKVAFRHRHQ
jgi:xanthine dehydrogenase large subunit